ncbi:MAG: insulinase family protein [Candidatus Amulumruptor caecigallinarius]|nr:insulinase family protein [Candidatus Amulumruptor caecigallinarius]MCM1396142.1 insulinase family protein [Candidatus Amulumruptor caecigallinarius]MCM1453858.1 insulinase family protein [bacterium]
MSLATIADEPWRAEETPLGEISGLSLPAMAVETLANGITLHRLSRGTAPVARVAVFVPGGEIDAEHRTMAGLSAELLREGSLHYPGGKLASLLESNGAWLGSEPLRHWRRFSLFSLTHRLPVVLPAMLDMIMHPEFSPGPFEACRQRLAAFQATEQRKVAFHARKLSAQMTWGATNPTAHFDTDRDIAAISRESVIDFHRRSLSTGGMHVYVSGGLTEGDVELIRRELSSLKSEGEGIVPVIEPPVAVAPSVEYGEVPGALQSAIKATIPAIPRTHPDYVGLRLAVTALGGYFGSRLNSVIREEKGLTYGINASLVGVEDTGYVSISSQADPQYVEQVISETCSELRRMAIADYPTDELTRLRRSVLSSLASTVESPFTISDYHETYLSANIPDGYFEAQLHALDHLTAEGLAELSARYLDPEQLRIAVAGPAPQS